MLNDKTVLVIGRGSGIARGKAQAVLDAGANVIVLTASARARGRLETLEREAIRRSLDTKVIGTAHDVASAAMLALTNTFMTGLTLHVDGASG
ncbi:MAG TPA: NAD(P)-dependent oxidoreductase [Solirubrobacter sp.]